MICELIVVAVEPGAAVLGLIAAADSVWFC